MLKQELGSIYVGVPGFYDTFFGGVEGLEAAGVTVFAKCQEGDNPLYSDETGWRDWPMDAEEKAVLNWLSRMVSFFGDVAREQGSAIASRTILAQPGQPLRGSTAERKLDVGFIDEQSVSQNARYHWSHVLIPGELKSNPDRDTSSQT